MKGKDSGAEAPQPKAPAEPGREQGVIPEPNHQDDSSPRPGTWKNDTTGLVSMERYDELREKIDQLEKNMARIEAKIVDVPGRFSGTEGGGPSEALRDRGSVGFIEERSELGKGIEKAAELDQHKRPATEGSKRTMSDHQQIESSDNYSEDSSDDHPSDSDDDPLDSDDGPHRPRRRHRRHRLVRRGQLRRLADPSDDDSYDSDYSDRIRLVTSTEWHGTLRVFATSMINLLVDKREGNSQRRTFGTSDRDDTRETGKGEGWALGRGPLPERILIRSPDLCSGLSTLLVKTPRNAGVVLLQPYKALVHQLNADREQDPPPQSPLELGTNSLPEFMDTYIKPKIEYIRSNPCTGVEFGDMWFLFQPGTEVVDGLESQAYLVMRVTSPSHTAEFERSMERIKRGADTDDPFTVHCVSIGSNGVSMGPHWTDFVIPPYAGEKRINALPVYPLWSADDGDLRTQLIERGKMFFDLCQVRSMYYTGPTLGGEDVDSQVVTDAHQAISNSPEMANLADTVDSIDPSGDDREGYVECEGNCCSGQVVLGDWHIDVKRFQEIYRSFIPERSSGKPRSLIIHPRTLKVILSSGNTPGDDEYLVMSSWIFGFVLRSRKWARLDLAYLSYNSLKSSQGTKEAFDSLVLPDGHRTIVQGLVTQHFRNREKASLRNERTDLIRGKGKGLIMLLHGAPGVGKTTTAEGIAERFNKPLFQITCGDLGTTTKEVEAELEKNFTLASKWGCILLLDEADVFLAQRERKDFVRNGLVAVFLRVLEYYTGILFLTTNRLGDIDEAFASRIHMSLRYPALDEDKTKRVFKLNLDMMKSRYEDRGQNLRFDEASLIHFAAQHYTDHPTGRWNGRQIRNACQTALALAEFEATGKAEAEEDDVSLGFAHFQKVQTAYLDFSQYLGDIFGTDQERRAHELQLRADDRMKVAGSRSRIDQHVAGRQHRASLSVGMQYEERQDGPAFGHGLSSYDRTFRPSSQHVGVAQAAVYPAEGAGQSPYRHDPSPYVHAGIPGVIPVPRPYGQGAAAGTSGHLYPSYGSGPGATPPPPPAPTSTEPPVHGHTYPDTHGPYPR